MKRKNSIIILIAMIATMLINWNSVHAATPIITKIFIADYDSTVNNGTYYAAMYDNDDHFSAIKITATKQTHYEDDLAIDNNQYVISSTLRLDSDTFTNNHHRFTWVYLDDSDIGTIDQADNSGTISYGTLNGDIVQFNGFVTNGATFILKEANAYSTHGLGWIVQNGNLISYAATVTEDETPNKVTPRIYMALMVR